MNLINKLTGKAKNILALIIGIMLTAFIGACLVPYVGENVSLGITLFLVVGNIALFVGFDGANVLASVCGLITATAVPDCTYPNTNGVKPIIYLANLSEIASATFTGSTLVMEAITMVSTKKFYAYEAKLLNVNHAEETKLLKSGTNFIHSVTTYVYKVDGAQKLELESMVNGQIVAITANVYQGNAGASEYEVHGWFQGLRAELKRDLSVQDDSGAYLLTLKTPEGTTEPHLPYSFYKTSRAATQALIAALIA